VNFTTEQRDTYALDFESGAVDTGSDSRDKTRPSGSVGVVFTAWKKDSNNVRVFGGYRDTYKPAAVDFGLSPAILGGMEDGAALFLVRRDLPDAGGARAGRVPDGPHEHRHSETSGGTPGSERG
jgi:hypothetical protein